MARAGRELDAKQSLLPDRVRRPGGGRKSVEVSNPKVASALARLVEPDTRGDPESPLRWTCKSTRRIAEELCQQGYIASHVTIRRLLIDADYSLQGNQKTMEGTSHPDRNAQFEYINAQAKRQLKAKQPLISVDTKKKELVGA